MPMVNFLASGVAGVGMAGAAEVAAGAMAVGAAVGAAAAVVGAATGAVVGAATGAVVGAATGAVVGAATGAVVGAGVAAGAQAPSIEAIVTNTTRIIKGLSCFILRFLLFVFLVVLCHLDDLGNPDFRIGISIHGYLCFGFLLDRTGLVS